MLNLFKNKQVLDIINSNTRTDLGNGLSIEYVGIVKSSRLSPNALEFCVYFEDKHVGFQLIGQDYFENTFDTQDQHIDPDYILQDLIEIEIKKLFCIS